MTLFAPPRRTDYVGWSRAGERSRWRQICSAPDLWECWRKLLEHKEALAQSERIVLKAGKKP